MHLKTGNFWRQAVAIQGSITPHVLPNVLVIGLVAAGICVTSLFMEKQFQVHLGLEIAPFEIIGVALGLLMVLRTNAGYDRWWEARKLWGGIVNQSRNLVITTLSYGPQNRDWQPKFVRWVAVFPHVACLSLRGEKPSAKVVALVGQEGADHLARADHMPSTVALVLGGLLREACDAYKMDRFAFVQADRERALLIDHLGGCERILKTPMPLVYSIKIRRFIALFLLTLPFALLHRLENTWLVPLLIMMVAMIQKTNDEKVRVIG